MLVFAAFVDDGIRKRAIEVDEAASDIVERNCRIAFLACPLEGVAIEPVFPCSGFDRHTDTLAVGKLQRLQWLEEPIFIDGFGSLRRVLIQAWLHVAGERNHFETDGLFETAIPGATSRRWTVWPTLIA